MRQIARFLVVSVALLGWAVGPPRWGVSNVAAEERHVEVINVTGVIDPVNAQYFVRAAAQAERNGAEVLIVRLDTPGGLDGPMRTIIRRMLSSTVPVVVYVSPPGARAASAGVFITVAADVAAMSPGTNIGAAHPVAGGGETLDATMNEKVTNDAVAYIRSIAAQKGHNPDWAEEAVRKSVSITEEQALELGVIDLVAEDLDQLLTKLDGRQVTTLAGERVLSTRGAHVQRTDMNFLESLLHVIVDPNIAYLLLTIGMAALLAEFYNPGALLPGITGVICLILFFVATESLPMNWAGVALIMIAIGLFVGDLMATTHGVLTVGGVVSFVLGSLLLFSPYTPAAPEMPSLRVNPWLVAIMTLMLAGLFTFALGTGLRAQRRAVTSGVETVVGQVGVATSDLTPAGTVLVQSETWSAVAEGEEIKQGQRVQVVAVEGLRVKVRRA